MTQEDIDFIKTNIKDPYMRRLYYSVYDKDGLPYYIKQYIKREKPGDPSPRRNVLNKEIK